MAKPPTATTDMLKQVTMFSKLCKQAETRWARQVASETREIALKSALTFMINSSVSNNLGQLSTVFDKHYVAGRKEFEWCGVYHRYR